MRFEENLFVLMSFGFEIGGRGLKARVWVLVGGGGGGKASALGFFLP